MTTRNLRRIHRPIPTPLARALALSLAIAPGIGGAAATSHQRSPAISPRPRSTRAVRGLDPIRLRRALTRDRVAAFAAQESRTLPAGAIVVTNCNDSGPGSLRDAFALAATGGSIDLTSMGCSTITLTTGAIVGSQDNLTLRGSRRPHRAIHRIAGDFSFQPISMSATARSPSMTEDHQRTRLQPRGHEWQRNGGCIFSAGTVALADARVDRCNAVSYEPGFDANGGAIYATAGIVMVDSRVGCSVAGGGGADGFGGGIATPGLLFMSSSTLYDNFAAGPGGGAVASGGVLAKYSSISGNAAYVGAGLVASGDIAIQSTAIAGNIARQLGGALLANSASGYPTTLRNSSVSNNHAGDFLFGTGPRTCAMAAPSAHVAPAPRTATGGVRGVVGASASSAMRR